jgi:hypothetical protein
MCDIRFNRANLQQTLSIGGTTGTYWTGAKSFRDDVSTSLVWSPLPHTLLEKDPRAG